VGTDKYHIQVSHHLRVGKNALNEYDQYAIYLAILYHGAIDIPECGTCQCPLTVKQITMECVDFNDVRNKHFVASSIKIYLIMSKHRTSLILSKKNVFVSNFNVFI